MQFYPHRTVEEQEQRLPEAFREAYANSHSDRITLFDGKSEIEVTGFAEYSYLEEKSYKTQPVRTEDGSIAEIEQYSTFLTPRLVIRYNMMGIDDYRAVMKMLKNRNGYIVKCYDIVEDTIVRKEMYVAPPSMPKIYKQYLSFMGVQDHTIEFIGTGCPIGGENGTQKIKFYIGAFSVTEYSANFGMTWRDFAKAGNKEFIMTDNSVYLDGKGYLKKDNTLVNPDDYIYIDAYYVY